MDTIDETRRKRLKLLVEKHRTQAALARALEKNPGQIAQWINQSVDQKTQKPRVMDSSSARDLEAKLKLPHAWMDQPINASNETQLLQPEEATLLDAWRLMSQEDKSELLAIAEQRVLQTKNATTDVLERLHLMRRADDERVATYLPPAPSAPQHSVHEPAATYKVEGSQGHQKQGTTR